MGPIGPAGSIISLSEGKLETPCACAGSPPLAKAGGWPRPGILTLESRAARADSPCSFFTNCLQQLLLLFQNGYGHATLVRTQEICWCR